MVFDEVSGRQGAGPPVSDNETGKAPVPLFNSFNVFNYLTIPVVGIDPIRQGVGNL